MTKQQAIEAMKKGMRVTHTSFTTKEWITIKKIYKGFIQDESGHKTRQDTWWRNHSESMFDDGWSYKYIPYSGGGGPTTKQRNTNTSYLGALLSEYGISFVKDYNTILEACGDPNYLMLRIDHPNTPFEMFVSYDRWGFTASIQDSHQCEDIIDQYNLEYTLINIIKWYHKK